MSELQDCSLYLEKITYQVILPNAEHSKHISEVAEAPDLKRKTRRWGIWYSFSSGSGIGEEVCSMYRRRARALTRRRDTVVRAEAADATAAQAKRRCRKVRSEVGAGSG